MKFHANDFCVFRFNDILKFHTLEPTPILHRRNPLNLGQPDPECPNQGNRGLSVLTWLNAGRPGGHKGHLSIIDTAALTDAYSDALASIDATDTLTAIAEKI